MSKHEKPDDDAAQSATDRHADEGAANPPTYPAYSTPPADGLPDAEHS